MLLFYNSILVLQKTKTFSRKGDTNNEKADVKVGAIVGAKSEEELKKPFQGKVEKIYENSALLAITSYDPVDKTAISDLNNKIVVNFKNLKAARAAKNSKTASTNEVKIEKIAKKDTDKKESDKK